MFGGEALKATKGVEPQYLCAATDAEGIEVLLNENGGRRMIFDKDNFRSTAAERFDAYSAGPCEEIEEAATGDAFGDDVEECFAQAVAGRAKGKALKTLELAAAKCSGNDAHGLVNGPQPTWAR